MRRIFIIIMFSFLIIPRMAVADLPIPAPQPQKLTGIEKVVVWVSSPLIPGPSEQHKLGETTIATLTNKMKAYAEKKLEGRAVVLTFQEFPISPAEKVDNSILVIHLLISQEYNEQSKHIAAIETVIGQGEGREDRLGVNALRVLYPNTSYPVIIQAERTADLSAEVLRVGKNAIDNIDRILR